jgi:hypothetical protein
MRFQLTPGRTIDVLLDLPWNEPLDEWHRHPATTGTGPVPARPGTTAPAERATTTPVDGPPTVIVDDMLVELREMPLADAERANRLLRELRDEGVDVVDVVGVVSGRVDDDGTELPAVLLTVRPSPSVDHAQVLAAELPTDDATDQRGALVDAAVELLVQLHLAGFVWGDGALARMRFRNDAGRLSATLTEVGAGELREELGTGDRLRDLEAATSAIAGELDAADVEQAAPSCGLHVLRHEVRTRYRRLWRDLTLEEEIDRGDRERGEQRLRRVNELGFDVEEVQVTDRGDGDRVQVGPAVLEPGHHRRRLRQLTGLVVGENQARRLLEDIERYRVGTAGSAGGPDGERAVPPGVESPPIRWLHEVFEPTVAAVPDEVRRLDLDDAEVFHEVLEHRYYLSERAGHDVGTQAAVDAYVADVLTPDAEAVATVD